MRPIAAHSRLRLVLIIGLILVLGLGLYAYEFLRPPEALYREAQNAPGWRASILYRRLTAQYPQIAEYFHLEEARHQMPGPEAIATLQDIISQHPHSPVAYEAYVMLARYYASSGNPQAVASYRSALTLEDSPALRDELARYLVELGDTTAAYSEYKQLLKDQPDAFTLYQHIPTAGPLP